MEYWYFFGAIVVAISIIGVIFCIVRGKGISHKILVFSTSLLCVVAMLCFGGNAILSMFGMGWRCTPFNTMLMLCAILSIIILCCCTCEFVRIKNTNIVLTGCGCISMALVVNLIVISAVGYFHLSSWHDGLSTYNDQTIVYANDQHGGSCSWRYYTHINDLVHGVEILQEVGWIGNPPHFYR